MSGPEIEEMYRLLAIAKYEDRYVIPTSYSAEPGSPVDLGCSLDEAGGPGMYDVEQFHTTSLLGTPDPVPEPATDPAGASLEGRVNLLGWNGQGRPDGLFPRQEGA